MQVTGSEQEFKFYKKLSLFILKWKGGGGGNMCRDFGGGQDPSPPLILPCYIPIKIIHFNAPLYNWIMCIQFTFLFTIC